MKEIGIVKYKIRKWIFILLVMTISAYLWIKYINMDSADVMDNYYGTSKIYTALIIISIIGAMIDSKIRISKSSTVNVVSKSNGEYRGLYQTVVFLRSRTSDKISRIALFNASITYIVLVLMIYPLQVFSGNMGIMTKGLFIFLYSINIKMSILIFMFASFVFIDTNSEEYKVVMQGALEDKEKLCGKDKEDEIDKEEKYKDKD